MDFQNVIAMQEAVTGLHFYDLVNLSLSFIVIHYTFSANDLYFVYQFTLTQMYFRLACEVFTTRAFNLPDKSQL